MNPATQLNQSVTTILVWKGYQPSGEWELDVVHRRVERLHYWKDSRRREEDHALIPLTDDLKDFLSRLVHNDMVAENLW
jgi:Ser/Thr protein kinase RdoA (MazF antagonist)